jgi:hypothetical protein
VPDDAAGLVVFLASAESEGITGQAIGIGGDKLSVWSHPHEVVAAYSDGGWKADDVAHGWRYLAVRAQSVGIPEPGPPPP